MPRRDRFAEPFVEVNPLPRVITDALQDRGFLSSNRSVKLASENGKVYRIPRNAWGREPIRGDRKVHIMDIGHGKLYKGDFYHNGRYYPGAVHLDRFKNLLCFVAWYMNPLSGRDDLFCTRVGRIGASGIVTGGYAIRPE